MALNFDPLAYMRFFVLLAPVILPAMAIFASLYEGNLKGFLYVFGLTISMAFGGMISSHTGKYVPHTGVLNGSGKIGDANGPFTPLIDPACNLIGANGANGSISTISGCNRFLEEWYIMVQMGAFQPFHTISSCNRFLEERCKRCKRCKWMHFNHSWLQPFLLENDT